MSPDARPPLAGKTTLTPADGAVLLQASRSMVGFFNQPRMLLYSALTSYIAAVLCIRGVEMVPAFLILLAAGLYVLAAVAGYRTRRLVGHGYGRNQEREIVLDDDGVTVREPGMTITYAWSRFDRMMSMRDHLALVAGAGIVLLPQRAFDADSFARVRELVAAKVPAQARR